MDTTTHTTPFAPSRPPHRINQNGWTIVIENRQDYFARLADEWLTDDKDETERRRKILHHQYTYPYCDAVILSDVWRESATSNTKESGAVRADVMLDEPDYGNGDYRSVATITIQTKRDNMPFGAITTFGMASHNHDIDKAVRLAHITTAIAEWAEECLYFPDKP